MLANNQIRTKEQEVQDVRENRDALPGATAHLSARQCVRLSRQEWRFFRVDSWSVRNVAKSPFAVQLQDGPSSIRQLLPLPQCWLPGAVRMARTTRSRTRILASFTTRRFTPRYGSARSKAAPTHSAISKGTMQVI